MANRPRGNFGATFLLLLLIIFIFLAMISSGFIR